MTTTKRKLPDLSQPVNLTAGVIERLACPVGRLQAFLRDKAVPGLAVRVTPTGVKAYTFERRLDRKTVRRTIGNVSAWTIEQARAEARRLAVDMDRGADPREVDRQKSAERTAKAAEQVAQALTMGEVWLRYCADRRPHWGDRHARDHDALADPGGARRKIGEGTTTAGPLAALMALRLVDLDGPAVESWAVHEAKTRPARLRLAVRLLKACLTWCKDEPDLAALVHADAANSRRARETAGRPALRDDVLEKSQLRAWFEAVQRIPNVVVRAYLQVLLLTGGRPGEVISLRWDGVDLTWHTLVIRDKVEGERVIPLTPYVEHLLRGLPRRNQWVFPAVRELAADVRNLNRRARRHAAAGTEAPAGTMAEGSASGRLSEPRAAHMKACRAAGVEGLTLHGLRQSYASLTEWLETPAGVVAQIMGHKPSATAERHYKRRPVDLLRVHAERIEAWLLRQAEVEMPAPADSTPLRIVTHG